MQRFQFWLKKDLGTGERLELQQGKCRAQGAGRIPQGQTSIFYKFTGANRGGGADVRLREYINCGERPCAEQFQRRARYDGKSVFRDIGGKLLLVRFFAFDPRADERNNEGRDDCRNPE